MDGYSRILASLGVACALGGTARAQNVLVVDAAGGPGSAYAEIADAVDAAGEGDLILVREGSYLSFVIDGKSLVVQAESGAQVVTKDIGVRNLTAGQSVSVRGIDWGPPSNGHEIAIYLLNNQGPVWIEDGEPSLEPSSCPPYSPCDIFCAVISGCSAVVLRDCSLGALPGSGGNTYDGVAIRNGSDATLYDCNVRGPDNVDFFQGFFIGGNGISVVESHATIHGCTVEGGDGDDINGTGIIVANNAGSVVDIIDSVVLNGIFAGSFGVVNQIPGTARFLSAPSPVRARNAVSGSSLEQPWSVTVSGEPNDTAWVLISGAPDTFYTRPAWVGSLALRQPVGFKRLGTLDASGSLTVSLPTPGLPLGVQGKPLYMQGLFLDDSPAQVYLGSTTQVNLIDPSL